MLERRRPGRQHFSYLFHIERLLGDYEILLPSPYSKSGPRSQGMEEDSGRLLRSQTLIMMMVMMKMMMVMTKMMMVVGMMMVMIVLCS